VNIITPYMRNKTNRAGDQPLPQTGRKKEAIGLLLNSIDMDGILCIIWSLSQLDNFALGT